MVQSKLKFLTVGGDCRLLPRHTHPPSPVNHPSFPWISITQSPLLFASRAGRAPSPSAPSLKPLPYFSVSLFSGAVSISQTQLFSPLFRTLSLSIQLAFSKPNRPPLFPILSLPSDWSPPFLFFLSQGIRLPLLSSPYSLDPIGHQQCVAESLFRRLIWLLQVC